MREIVRLGYQSAIDAIAGHETVMYKSGCWNTYERKDVATVIQRINNSGYGADVDEGEDGTLYVCTPCASDMW